MTSPTFPRSDAAELLRLVDAALAGDQQAFARIVELKRDQVFRTAYQQVGNAEDARVVAQDVFVRLWRHLDRYDRTRRFDTWLYQVTINAAIDHHRRQRHRSVETEFDETFLSPAAGTAAGLSGGAEESLEAREVQAVMTDLAKGLTEKQRAAFVLREIEGLSTAEVAQALDATESTVRNHVFQARQYLREALLARYPEYAPRDRTAATTPESPEPRGGSEGETT